MFDLSNISGYFGALFLCSGRLWDPSMEGGYYLENHPGTRKWLVTPIYKPFRPFGRGTTLFRGLTNHGY